ncbi:cysteine-rich repeat secretory protein 38-like [Gastrolobium bilobum]|uniref:cysteine-rich repeat secretory protein 38-like n=1 Tax=Gastrolobium bilobum TaxID=150636 RepID=UPI002AB0DD86|nr:cysteine-rich repeat secretory protein 38-like [Gastrolobium bilobum]
MSCSKLISSFLFSLTLVLLLQTSFEADPLFHSCSSSEIFTSNTPYESNLKTLINSLIYKTPSTGFGVSSVGQYESQPVYGLALCRVDVSPTECKTCVIEATKEILNLCPYNKGAIIWYDNCLFKYLDTDFISKIDEANKFSLLNVQDVSDPNMFNYMTKELLGVHHQVCWIEVYYLIYELLSNNVISKVKDNKKRLRGDYDGPFKKKFTE